MSAPSSSQPLAAKLSKTKSTGTKKAAKPTTHPSWKDMIKECITAHPTEARSGVSRSTIKKFAETKYKLDMNAAAISQLSRAITHGAEHGVFALPKGPSGKVKLAPKAKTDASKENAAPTKAATTKKAPVAKKAAPPTAKKPAAKKAAPAAAKKTGDAAKAKKSTTAKTTVKKAAAKKAAAKPKAVPKTAAVKAA